MISGGGVSVVVYEPIKSGYGQITSFSTRDINSYSHNIEAVGGFATANIEIAADVSTVSDWLDNGIGRHVVVYGPGGAIAWEGFVNQISSSMSGLDLEYGSIMEMANKVKVKYQTISWDIPDTPVAGVQSETAFAEDSDSQERYFILEDILNIGEASETLNQPTNVRDMYLNEMAWPKTSQTVSILAGDHPTVTLNCIGYFNILKRSYYSKTGTVSSMDASDKIIDVVNANPNSIVKSTTRVESNTTPVPEHEEGDSTGWDVILDTLSYGTSSNYRYNVGMVEDRTLYGEEVNLSRPNIEYTIRIRSQNPVLGSYPSGGTVPKSLVRPGRWLLITDTMASYPGNQEPLFSYRDPRMVFIESVEYNADGSLTLSSSTQNRVDRTIARIGLDTLYIT